MTTQHRSTQPVKLHLDLEQWPLIRPFRISGYTWEVVEIVRVSLERDHHVGQGEAFGVYYRGETAASLMKTIEAVAAEIESGIDREFLQKLLPAGGARNAVDCALWDLEAKSSGRPVWQLAGLEQPRGLINAITCGAEAPEAMAAAARAYHEARAIKIKLTGEEVDAERVRAVREAREDVRLIVDANQGFTLDSLQRLMPVLVEAQVVLIEQPFPVGQERLLENFQSTIPIAADESVRERADLEALLGLYQVINIKLDKCGGLTEGLAMARSARALGFDLMAGNMFGTSLAMAPGFLLGQLCTIIDLDGPVIFSSDRATPVRYCNGYLTCPEELWGYPT